MWTSARTRTTKRYPGRIIFVIVNLTIALALMEGDMFSALAWILGFYSNFAIARWWWSPPISPSTKAC